MIYRNEENCLRFFLPVWRFFSSTINILEITHITTLKFKERWRWKSWIVLYLPIHAGQLSVSSVKVGDYILYRCK